MDFGTLPVSVVRLVDRICDEFEIALLRRQKAANRRLPGQRAPTGAVGAVARLARR